jgi:hypothetical protein
MWRSGLTTRFDLSDARPLSRTLRALLGESRSDSPSEWGNFAPPPCHRSAWRFHRRQVCNQEVRGSRRDAPDAFYLLIDAFRYQIMVSPIVRRPPVLAKPSSEVLEELRRRGDEIYAEFFCEPIVEETGVPATV